MLIYDTSKYLQSVWQGHIEAFRTAQAVMDKGQKKHYQFPAFADDVHAQMFLGHAGRLQAEAPRWGTDVLALAECLPEWQTLRARCQADAFLAGLATELVLPTLIDLMPEAQEPPKPEEPEDLPGLSMPGSGGAQGSGQSGAGPGSGQNAGASIADGTSGQQRMARLHLRQACKDAIDAVEQADAQMEPLRQAMGGWGRGDTPVQPRDLDIQVVRELYAQLARYRILDMVAMLCGRLQREFVAHKTSPLAARAGRITGVEVGGDVPRILASAWAGTRPPASVPAPVARVMRYQAYAAILGKRVLQYTVEADEQAVRGPIAYCMDESASMSREQIAWTKAMALFLLLEAQKQNRAIILIGFDDKIRRSYVARPGEALDWAKLLPVLGRYNEGDTDFNKPLMMAHDLIMGHAGEEGALLAKGDILFATDGQAQVSEEVRATLQAAREEHGLRVYAIGIGRHATLENLQPFADGVYHLSARPAEDQGELMPMLTEVFEPEKEAR